MQPAWGALLALACLSAACGRAPRGVEVTCTATPPDSAPWYSTVAPSEAGNSSARTHHYDGACSAVGPSAQPALAFTAEGLPGLYNVVTRAPGELFALGGSFGHYGDDNGPWVAALDSKTLAQRWRTRLPGMAAGDWNYPGVMGVHGNGDLYAIYSHHIARLDPATGAVKAHADLPVNQPGRDVAYNGFVLLSDGRIAAKSIHRKPGCTEPDFKAFLGCETQGMAASTLVLVDPETLAVVQSQLAPEHVRFRLTGARLDDAELLYLPGEARLYRYRYAGGRLALDPTWQPGYLMPGQQPGTAVAVLGDWIVIQTNGIPAAVPLSIVATSQRDPLLQHRLEPFAAESGRGSFIPSMPTVDPVHNRIYTFDAYAGQLAALKFDAGRGLSVTWQVPQRSFAFSALVGPPSARVLVSTDMTSWLGDRVFPRLSFARKLALTRRARGVAEDVVWRDAASGQELGRVADVAAVGGSVPVPGFDGVFYAPDLRAGTLSRLGAFGPR